MAMMQQAITQSQKHGAQSQNQLQLAQLANTPSLLMNHLGMSPSLAFPVRELTDAEREVQERERAIIAGALVRVHADRMEEAYDRLTLWIEAYRWPLVGILFAPIVKRLTDKLGSACDDCEHWLARCA